MTVKRAARLLAASWIGSFVFGAVAAHRNRDRRPYSVWCSRHHGPWLMVDTELTERHARLSAARHQRTADQLRTGARFAVAPVGERPS